MCPLKSIMSTEGLKIHTMLLSSYYFYPTVNGLLLRPFAEWQSHDDRKENQAMRLTYRELMLMKRLLENYFWALEEWDANIDEMPDDMAVRERKQFALVRTVHTSLWRKVGIALERQAERMTRDQLRRADIFRSE